MIYRLSEIDIPGVLSRVIPRWVTEVALAIMVIGIIVILRLGIDLVTPGAVPFALIFPGVLFATVLGGWRSGVVTMVVGGCLIWYVVMPPARTLIKEDPASIVSILLYVFSASVIILFTNAFRRSGETIAAERAAVRESEERFRLVAENAPVNLWMGDASGKCVYLNEAQRQFWGVPEDLSGFTWSDHLLPEDRAPVFAVFDASMKRQASFEVEARYYRADGEVRTLATKAQPRRGVDGAFLGMIGVNVDVTEARQAERHQRLLLDELNHRVKNTLATVQSLAYQSLRGRDSHTAIDVFTARLLALSAAHDVLTRENWAAASLHDVVAQAIRAYEHGPSRFVTDGPAVRVSPRVALALSMALHELATNAVKYGALSVDNGSVGIRWQVEGGLISLEWRESGGPAVVPPAHRGFGSRLLQDGLVGDLGASPKIDYAPAGVVCRFQAPVASPAELN